ncbi:SDR family NAD(P)-dependent oxidoreductase [Arthrobacter sp. I2-34]|uniref:SDR family NAD(P)-dependent oxidoreductase n=1 Tax=Arthrobacter hankyongi TaxID=2904801 RepID=A0ABS9LBR8_9MICC|nr:SDR family NAD(P)-dependent oxidoreductase [Arthrobacter hankyongi]MCG2624110.1 SDR family NAD(P)-dependent oxidoreductase [Arthrobacter hankyongi]
MPESLDGTIALVTGASSGIGRAAAKRMAGEGAAVSIVARRRDRLEALAAEIRSAGGRACIVEADVTAARAAAEVVEKTVAEFGRLDTVVNAAGTMLNGDSVSSPLQEWDRMVDLNLKALMYVTKAALPHLLDGAQTGGRKVTDVVNIGSIAGRVPNARVAIYNATKFGVTAATEAWRQEFANRNVRFSVIAPGAVDTELFGHQQQTTQEHYTKLFSAVEKLHADDIAGAIAYIVTNPRRIAVNELVIRPTDQTL